jgi:hypothetical protein
LTTTRVSAALAWAAVQRSSYSWGNLFSRPARKIKVRLHAGKEGCTKLSARPVCSPSSGQHPLTRLGQNGTAKGSRTMSGAIGKSGRRTTAATHLGAPTSGSLARRVCRTGCTAAGCPPRCRCGNQSGVDAKLLMISRVMPSLDPEGSQNRAGAA